ncbi:BrxE family protein [uncultured Amphritea sp.]|uniref:BrxE family protein n=1 Tax=uncultured Amphritea sp. TaxID=981605 RepID=UPI00262D6201|nr:BrxE family protein [uncultured Amphritea sp.]
MTPDLTNNLVRLRTCVAFLGEKGRHSWWLSTFLSRSGEAFLNPVFPKTSVLARVSGASAAAQVTHDEHIGVGDVFHLFRLPENVEHDISQSLIKDATIIESIGSEDDAYILLQELACGDTMQGIGPLLLDQGEINQSVMRHMAAAYLSGFTNKQAVYPYYRGQA